MSASLVGSEMCIRDSVHSARAGEDRDPCAQGDRGRDVPGHGQHSGRLAGGALRAQGRAGRPHQPRGGRRPPRRRA
eukprot:8990088-Alexandrium_andersonii.AAC.1